jgi:archaellum component FlaC
MQRKYDEELAESLREDMDTIDNETEELSKVLKQIEQLEEEVSDNLISNTREAERIYDYWRGSEALKCVNTMIDSGSDSARQIRTKANTLYDEVKHSISRLGRKHETLSDELSRFDTQE